MEWLVPEYSWKLTLIFWFFLSRWLPYVFFYQSTKYHLSALTLSKRGAVTKWDCSALLWWMFVGALCGCVNLTKDCLEQGKFWSCRVFFSMVFWGDTRRVWGRCLTIQRRSSIWLFALLFTSKQGSEQKLIDDLFTTWEKTHQWPIYYLGKKFGHTYT